MEFGDLKKGKSHMNTVMDIMSDLAALPEDRRFRLLALFYFRALWKKEMGIAFALSFLAFLLGDILEEAFPSVSGLIEAGARMISVSAVGTALILGVLKEVSAYAQQRRAD